jgi:acyl-coenzyme A synthetase/AMP-(fatty) acid ligase
VPTLPLLFESDPAATVAVRGGQAVSQERFLAEVEALAGRLPAGGEVLNFCSDRYAFSLGLLAAIARGIPSHLPHSTARGGISQLAQGIPGLVCLIDREDPGVAGLACLDVARSHLEAPGARPAPRAPFPTGQPMPMIPADRLVAHVYTSGSTGEPRGHAKTFGRLRAGAMAQAERLRAIAGAGFTVVGTVPFQHMYGLESTVLLPLLAGGRISARRPLFPADVAQALAEVPAPRVLVTTPFHLRKLVDSEVAFPAVAALLSATAPLSGELAREAEARMHTRVLEIYGSTETGQVATRASAREEGWTTYPGVHLRQEGGATIASGESVEGEQELHDVIEWMDGGRFRLVGRSGDMINVAGKRSSLAGLNRTIASVPGVVDAAFHVPPQGDERAVPRLAAFVVAPGLEAGDILAALRPHLDAAFLPRPLVLVDALPRDGNGKIASSALEELARRHLAGGD